MRADVTFDDSLVVTTQSLSALAVHTIDKIVDNKASWQIPKNLDMCMQLRLTGLAQAYRVPIRHVHVGREPPQATRGRGSAEEPARIMSRAASDSTHGHVSGLADAV